MIFLKKDVYSKTHTVSSVIFFSLTTVLLLSFGLTEDVFAVAGPEYDTPTQPNAYASYTNATNQIQVSWDFDSLPADTICLLKSDVRYNENVAGTGSEDYTSSFTPLYYSPLTATPVAIQAVNNDESYAEEVSCTGDVRIDIDTIMNHSENINNYPDMQLFLTFYAPLPNGDFNVDNENRLDEVFVMYAPGSIFDKDAQDYGCGGQIGSTLYIDASGSDVDGKPSLIAHGNNGDNCDNADFKYLVLDNDQYVDIGMIGSGSHGTAVYDYHDESSFSLWLLVVEPSTGGSGCNDCISPTFYYSQHEYIVKNAFTYNDYSTDVTDGITEIPLIETKINQQNQLILRVYDNGGTDNIKWVDVGFGIPTVNPNFNKSEVTIEIKFQNNNVVETKIIDPLNLIDFGVIVPKVVNCGYIDKNCLQVTIPHSFRDKLVNTNLMISTSDYEPNQKNHIISGGIKVQGDSIDPPPTHNLFIKKYLGSPDSEWVVITLDDRSNDIWVSDDGSEFTSTYGGGFMRITPLSHDPNLE